MNTIDWSKAPEGFDVHIQWEGGLNSFYKDEGNKFTRECGRYALKHEVESMGVVVTRRPWSGEGLPPVGTVCEIKNGKMGWVQCEIIAHKHFDCGSKPHAIAWIDVNNIDQSEGIRFRKIKSPEQIANDERKKAVMEMISDGGSTLDVVEFVGRLYDANYRKQEAK